MVGWKPAPLWACVWGPEGARGLDARAGLGRYWCIGGRGRKNQRGVASLVSCHFVAPALSLLKFTSILTP